MQKMNVIAWLKFELDDYNVGDQHVTHYATGDCLNLLGSKFWFLYTCCPVG